MKIIRTSIGNDAETAFRWGEYTITWYIVSDNKDNKDDHVDSNNR